MIHTVKISCKIKINMLTCAEANFCCLQSDPVLWEPEVRYQQPHCFWRAREGFAPVPSAPDGSSVCWQNSSPACVESTSHKSVHFHLQKATSHGRFGLTQGFMSSLNKSKLHWWYLHTKPHSETLWPSSSTWVLWKTPPHWHSKGSGGTVIYEVPMAKEPLRQLLLLSRLSAIATCLPVFQASLAKSKPFKLHSHNIISFFPLLAQ